MSSFKQKIMHSTNSIDSKAPHTDCHAMAHCEFIFKQTFLFRLEMDYSEQCNVFFLSLCNRIERNVDVKIPYTLQFKSILNFFSSNFVIFFNVPKCSHNKVQFYQIDFCN